MGTARVFMYHNVALDPRNMWYVSPQQLRGHVDTLRAQGYVLGSLADLLQGRDRLAVITFDDAYANVYEQAFPLLQALGVAGTVLVPVNLVGGMNTFDALFDAGPRRAERLMSWSQLRELQSLGWSIQSHGCSHLPLNWLLPEQVEDEIVRSKQVIEDMLGAPVFAYAYAYGALPDRSHLDGLEELFQSNGYRLALLAGGGPTSAPPARPYQVTRILATGDQVDLGAGPPPGTRTGPTSTKPGPIEG